MQLLLENIFGETMLSVNILFIIFMYPHLNGRLVGPQLCFQPLVLLPQILHSRQITSIVLRTHQQLLFPGEDTEGTGQMSSRTTRVCSFVRYVLIYYTDTLIGDRCFLCIFCSICS